MAYQNHMRPVRPKSKASQALRAQRESLKYKQEDLAAAAGDLVSQGTVSDLETGRVRLEKMEMRRLTALARALNWTLLEMQEATGIDFAVPRPIRGENAQVVEGRWASVLDMASATRPTGYDSPVQLPMHFIPREHDRPGTVPVVVRGDSMSPTINEGDIVYADRHDLNYQDGKIFVFNVVGDGMCVKRARDTVKGWMLTSDNTAHMEFAGDQIEIFGRVYFIAPQGKKA